MNIIHAKTEQLDLNLLKVFEAAYREQHLGRAAQSLRLTPSAVSHALRRLRVQLGDPLFVRDGRRMLPTPACQRLAPPLLEALAQLRQLLQQRERFDPSQARQAFHVGMPYAIEAMLLPAIYRLLRERAPQAALSSVAYERRELGRTLAAGQLDIAIDVALPAAEPVRHAALLQEPFCIAVRSRHPLKRRPTLPQFLAAQHVAVSGRASGAVVEDIALLNLGMQRRIALRCQNYHSACRVVAASDHLLTMPTGLARQMANRSLRLLPLPFDLPPIQPHLYWHANTAADPANQWLRQLVFDACRLLASETD